MIRRVLVTGASRGIGRAVADRLAAEGRQVVAMSRRPDAEGPLAIACDLSTVEGARAAVPRAIEALGGLDAFVHCAGIADHRALADVDETQIDAHLRVHVRAPLILARDLARHLAGRPGSIVLLASTLALQGVAGTLAYGASKGAVIAMTRTLAVELAPHVRVNCVAPGVVATDMIGARAADLAAIHPLGRVGDPDEIASTIAHVLDAGFMTGSIVTIDGGLTARG